MATAERKAAEIFRPSTLAAKAQANGKLLYQTEAYLAYGFDSVESLKKLLPIQSE